MINGSSSMSYNIPPTAGMMLLGAGRVWVWEPEELAIPAAFVQVLDLARVH
jgi:hypothetical protein